MRVIFLVIKFGVLAITYLFIIRVFYFILSDLNRVSQKGGAPQARPQPQSGAELVVTGSSDPLLRPGEIFILGDNTRLGRGPHNHVNIADTFVSHDHAQIIFKTGKHFLEDLGSINGTYINGVRVSGAMPLAHGDVIRIAGVTFKFVRWQYEVE